MKKWKICVINLARSKDRLTACARQLASYDLAFERIEAVDGEALDSAFIDKIYDFQKSTYHKHMTSGEIGCYLSHVRAWQKIVDENLDFALILEDDIVLHDDIKRGLDAVQTIQEPWDLIKLAEAPIKRKVVHSIPLASFSLVTYNKVPIRCCAQIISLAGAKKLLATSANITRPIDIEMQHWWESGLQIFGMKPYIAKPNHHSVSEIDRSETRKKAKQSFFRKVVSGFSFLFKNKRALKKRLELLSK